MNVLLAPPFAFLDTMLFEDCECLLIDNPCAKEVGQSRSSDISKRSRATARRGMESVVGAVLFIAGRLYE